MKLASAKQFTRFRNIGETPVGNRLPGHRLFDAASSRQLPTRREPERACHHEIWSHIRRSFSPRAGLLASIQPMRPSRCALKSP